MTAFPVIIPFAVPGVVESSDSPSVVVSSVVLESDVPSVSVPKLKM